MYSNLVYAGKIGGMHAVHGLADGDRPVIAFLVADNGQISICTPDGALDTIQSTKGMTHIADGKVCIGCIATYVLPRSVTLLARLYVPKNGPVLVDVDLSLTTDEPNLG